MDESDQMMRSLPNFKIRTSVTIQQWNRAWGALDWTARRSDSTWCSYRNPTNIPLVAAARESSASSGVVSHLRFLPNSIDVLWSLTTRAASWTSFATSLDTWSMAARGHSGCRSVDETKGNKVPSSSTWICGLIILNTSVSKYWKSGIIPLIDDSSQRLGFELGCQAREDSRSGEKEINFLLLRQLRNRAEKDRDHVELDWRIKAKPGRGCKILGKGLVVHSECQLSAFGNVNADDVFRLVLRTFCFIGFLSQGAATNTTAATASNEMTAWDMNLKSCCPSSIWEYQKSRYPTD